jgi:hypothetical protein
LTRYGLDISMAVERTERRVIVAAIRVECCDRRSVTKHVEAGSADGQFARTNARRIA